MPSITRWEKQLQKSYTKWDQRVCRWALSNVKKKEMLYKPSRDFNSFQFYVQSRIVYIPVWPYYKLFQLNWVSHSRTQRSWVLTPTLLDVWGQDQQPQYPKTLRRKRTWNDRIRGSNPRNCTLHMQESLDQKYSLHWDGAGPKSTWNRMINFIMLKHPKSATWLDWIFNT